jgi:2-methylcitrate dehydratase PrpD
MAQRLKTAMNALETLAHHLASLTLPAPASRGGGDGALRELVELHLIDTVGASIAGMGTAEGLLLLKFRAATRANARQGDGVPALDLSTRCALARASEIDDIHLASMTTPGGIVIPAALTLAVATPAAAIEEVTAAIVAGYEAMTRLGRAIDGPSVLYRGIWPTYFAAPFAVAAVAARLFKLDAMQTANALALALTLCAPGVGGHHAATTARWFAIGEAATRGVTAALAAQQGFTCDLDLITGNFFPQVYGIAPQSGALTDRLGKQSTLTEVSFKPWCAARQTMAATQALLEIIDSGIPPQSIAAFAFLCCRHIAR